VFPEFLWGAATAAHQVEGSNLNSDWWVRENAADPGHISEPSNDAADSYHRFGEDMALLAGAGPSRHTFLPVDYTTGALEGLQSAIDDGIDVRGYLHWSALDNYEWGSYRPTFGLIAFDHETFIRTPSGASTGLALWLLVTRKRAGSCRVPPTPEIRREHPVSSLTRCAAIQSGGVHRLARVARR
jgi:beta-glucosidase/6-phospho-beta-glucosidase/beta-galactosidase